MRVAILADNLAFGGVNRYCLDLVEGLEDNQDIAVSLLALGDRSEKWLLEEATARNVMVEVLPMYNPLDLRVAALLYQILNDRRIDILHSQAYRSSILARLTVRIGRLPSKLIHTVHGVYQFTPAPPRLKTYYYLDYLSMSMSDSIIAVSESTKKQIPNLRARANTTVIHNGTRLPDQSEIEAKLETRQMLGIDDNRMVVGFIGRLSYQKGVQTLVDVVRTVLPSREDIVFIIIGDGAERPRIEEIKIEFPNQIYYLGYQSQVNSYLPAIDIVIIPSPMEGFPMVLLEAFANSIPVVASNVGGIPEIVTDGHNGFLCDPADKICMSERLIQLSTSSELRTLMGNNARKAVEHGYSLSSMAEKTHGVYLSAINRART